MQNLTKEEWEYRRDHGFDPKYLKHHHKFLKFGEPTGFSFCLANTADDCDPRSHGGVLVHAKCVICGEVRNFNVNGDHVEVMRKGDEIVGWE